MSRRPGAAPATVEQSTRDVHPLPRQVGRRQPHVSIESVVDDTTARRFYALYEKTFGDLAVQAVARQLLHEDEFMAEMVDERVEKYLAWDEDGEPVAMSTLTRHLETVPWISPAYFAHHYPEHTARGAVYYMGFILVDQEHQRAHLFLDLVKRMVQTLEDKQALCAYDICSHNNEVMALADVTASLITSLTPSEVSVVDTQTYYCAVSLTGKKVPEMRRLRRE